MIKQYAIAGLALRIETSHDNFCQELEGHYHPFETSVDEPCDLTVNLTRDMPDIHGLKLVFRDDEAKEGMVRTDLYGDTQGNLLFDIYSPGSDSADGRLFINHDLDKAIFSALGENKKSVGEMVTTCAIQLSYMIAGAQRHLLMSHSSCVVHNGRAYMFIAPSGTGKSTHSQLWLDCIDNTMLLNDDHPIVKAAQDSAIAYGSPWSGKTDCYVNSHAPLAGIVRIKQAGHNAIRRLNAIEAYASLIASFSGLTFMPQFADARHADIERLVLNVPCYELECLPEHSAAVLCHKTITSTLLK